MQLTDGAMIKKYHVALFINIGTPLVPVWKRIEKSTDNTLTMNGETKEYDYIVDESPTTELDKYKPTLSQPVTMYKGKPDYEFLFSKMFNQSVGDDAKAEVLVVFFGHNDGSAYKAWKSSCLFVIDNMNPVDSTITASINFNGKTETGTVIVDKGVPVFTSSTQKEFLFTVNVKAGAVDVEGATVDIGGVRKLTGADGNVTFILIDGMDYVVGAWDATRETCDKFTAAKLITTMELEIV